MKSTPAAQEDKSTVTIRTVAARSIKPSIRERKKKFLIRED